MSHLYSNVYYFIALTVNSPYTKVPYETISVENIRGWPTNIPFIHPSILSFEQLKVIENNIDKIEFIGIYITCTYFVITIISYM